MIDFRNFKDIMACAKKSQTLSNVYHRVPKSHQEEVLAVIEKHRQYDQDVYALAVFRVFSLMNPMMVERKTGKRLSFRDAFGVSFDEVKQRDLQVVLAGLMSRGSWQYEFEECVTTVEGKVLTTIKLWNDKEECYNIETPRLP